MMTFDEMYELAVARKGEAWLNDHYSTVHTDEELRATPDDRWLAGMTRCVFAAGFRWRVIQAKWDGFEEAFLGFDPATVAEFDEDAAGALAHDTRIVRNPQKIRTTIDNASYVRSVSTEHGSFGDYIADWPADDIVGLWAALKRDGHRLGGNTGPRFLRIMGKDTFILTPDVTLALSNQGVMTAKPTSRKGQTQANAAFCTWAEESGRPLCEISQVVACTVERAPD